MSGWEDIDGSSVMCGSPGRLVCLDMALKGVLGLGPPTNGLGTFVGLIGICKDQLVTEELKVAAQLIQLARRILVAPSGARTPLAAAKDAVERLRKAVAEDEGNLNNWEQNAVYLKAEYARGDDWWVEK